MSNIKIENVEVYGFRHALRAMRNPMDSWDRIDSFPVADLTDPLYRENVENVLIGPKDLELVLKLVKAGSEHSKFLRCIMVYFDLTAPRYVLTEFDTYKVGTVRNSCSTMHKLGKRPLVPEDFAQPEDNEELEWLMETINYLNTLGSLYRETKKYNIVKKMKRALPEGFLQKASFCMNYAVLLNMFLQRKGHRLDEWRLTDGTKEESICNWIKSLPYMAQIIAVKEKKND